MEAAVEAAAEAGAAKVGPIEEDVIVEAVAEVDAAEEEEAKAAEEEEFCTDGLESPAEEIRKLGSTN